MTNENTVQQDLVGRFGSAITAWQPVLDDIPTLWAAPERAEEILRYLKTGLDKPYRMLYDLFAVDESMHAHRPGLPAADFSIVYHLLSFDRNSDIRVRVPVSKGALSANSVTGVWPAANWYEREAWDMFGVRFDGHPGLRRILMPPWWEGHPLRKDYPARATEMPPFSLTAETANERLRPVQFDPSEWGLQRKGGNGDYLFLNVGPHHPAHTVYSGSYASLTER